MSDMEAWLGSRTPEAPADLRRLVLDAVAAQREETGPDETGPAETFMRAGQVALDDAVRRPGRVREAAFKLLVADALVTYACEAALVADRPLEALGRIVEVGRTR